MTVGVVTLIAVCSAQMVVATAAEPGPVTIATDRQEELISDRAGVTVSYVSFLLPLGSDAPVHPEACDRTGFLRYRSSDGPSSASDADAVVVQQQGLMGGAVNSDSVAVNTVQSARRGGQRIEFWAMARRSSCLDEKVGFDYAMETGNYLDAVDYYFNGKPINGRQFAGFRSSQDLALLDVMGMERVLRDQYEVMLHDLPDQAVRRQKAVCTGISLGGLMTGFFADWDFDGNPATRSDAGYDQCAAFVAQDSMVSSDPVAIQNTPFFRDVTDAIIGPTNDLLKTGFRAGALPRILGPTPVVGAKATVLYRLAALAAHLAPDAESQLLAHIPRELEMDATLNFTFASSWSAFATNGADGTGTMRDYRFTNTALLGALLDNNCGNFALLQQGLGALSGGPVQEKTFPNPGSIAQIPLFGNFLRLSAGPQQRVAPTDRNVLYTWRNYNDVRGVPFTSPSHEVADIRDLARQLGTGSPMAYWETYFPLRIVVDIAAGFAGARGTDMTNLRYHGMSRIKPNLALFAGDSVVQSGVNGFFPAPPTAQVNMLPGYNHIDTIGAAAVQNNGQPDYSGQYLAEFIKGLG
ncbi:hypothetical protein ACWIGW_41450 [Nocardia brasiliensis]